MSARRRPRRDAPSDGRIVQLIFGSGVNGWVMVVDRIIVVATLSLGCQPLEPRCSPRGTREHSFLEYSSLGTEPIKAG